VARNTWLLAFRAYLPRGRWQRTTQEVLGAPPMARSPSRHSWRALAIPPSSRRDLACLSCYHDAQRTVRTHKMIIRQPPLHVRFQMRGLQGRCPRAARQCCHPTPDRQVHSLDERRIYSSGQAQCLQGCLEGFPSSQSHHVLDPYQLASAIAHLALAHTVSFPPPATAAFCSCCQLLCPTAQNARSTRRNRHSVRRW
jgi:hypothetical protein